MIQKRSSAPKVRMAATIWFSVREEKKMPDGDERRPHEEEPQVAVEDRGDLGIAVEEGEEREEAGQAEHGQEDEERGEELAEDDLADRDRRGVEELLGPDLLLLGEEAHGQEREHEEEDDADVVEEGLRRPSG